MSGARSTVVHPKWMLLLAVLVAAITARLGWWQLQRAEQKLDWHTQYVKQRALPSLPAAQWPHSRTEAQALTHRLTQASGRWDSERTIYLENRQMGGQPGFYVLTPLLMDDGSAVVVQRGWLPRDPRDRSRVERPAESAPPHVVQGRIAPSIARLFEFEAVVKGPIRQNLDVEAFSAEIGRPLRPFILIQEEAAGLASDGLARNWPEPSAGVHKHYGYAFQWFALSTLTIGLYVWFQIIRPRRRA